jgi:tetratricopeptide (TPR) repeat protein
MRLRSVVLPAVVSLFLGPAYCALAQDSSPAASVWDGVPFHASPDEVLKAAAAVPSSAQSNITVLLDERRIVLDKDQKATVSYHLVYRIENQAGVEAWASVGAGYSPWFQKRPELQARIITEDKHVYTLDPKTLSDAPVHAGEEDMFNDDREYQGPLPGLASGAVVEEFIRIEDTAPFFSVGSVYREYLNRPFPVAMTRVIAQAPVALALKYKVRKLPDVTAQKETTDGIVTLTFEKENLEAVDHVAPNLPSDVAPVPEIEVATAASWKDVADRYRAMSDPQLHPEEAKAMLPQLPKGVDRNAKITAIVRELHHQVRYTGVEFGEAKLTPQPPAETMKRHYGDCKDKAALLVSMLRAAGIPAYLALLDAGEGQDVDPALPGMRLFDHAIVYVPGEKQSDAGLWIDATAEFAQVGELPAPDRGRHALIIREGTAELTTIPASTSEDNILIEHRTFTLAENGPAHVEERTETHGMVDEIYRSRYGGSESKRAHEELENYVKSVYSAEKLDDLKHSDGNDLSKPFELDLVMDKARRGYSSLQDAAVAIPLGSLFYRLPQWFFTAPPNPNSKGQSAREMEEAREENARTEDYVFEPFVNEWKYTVVPPLGFKAQELPAEKKEQLGPALLTTHYAVQPDGTVTADVRFDTVRGRYTAKEAMELRQAIDARRNEDAVMLRFVEGGAYELSQGHVKEALAVYQGLIAKHPKEGLHHEQMAAALVQASAGEQARAEAAIAVKLEWDSALAFRNQGDVLSYDTVGRKFAAGMDRAGAIAAYKRSLDLEPDDAPTRWQLAVLYEFNAQGERYGKGADFDLAVEQYRAATERDKTLGRAYDENAALDLFYGGKDAEALKAAHALNASDTRNAVAIAAAAMTGGADAALQEAGRDAEDGASRSNALGDAGQLLVKRRKYALAADLFEASLHDAKDAPLRQRQVEIFRTLQPYEQALFPTTDPRRAVQDYKLITFRNDFSNAMLAQVFSPVTLQPSDATKHMLEQYRQGAAQVRSVAQKDGLTPDNLADVMIGSAKYSVEGSDAVGYRITVTSLGENAQVSYVMKLPNGYRLLTNDPPGRDAGDQVLDFLNAGNLDGARQWLDWAREKVKRGDADDPLAGPMLPRFWGEGENGGVAGKPDPDKMRIAGYALLAATESAEQYLPVMAEQCATAFPQQPQDCNLLLLTAQFWSRHWAEALKLSAPMLLEHPRSHIALFYTAVSQGQLKQYTALQHTAETALALEPNGADTLRLLSQANAFSYKYGQAETYLKKLQDEGKADASDYNSLAWLSLFAGHVDDDAVHAAQQGNLLTKSENFAILHTLACLYAATGKSEQARQTLLQAMDVDALQEPNSSAWYAFGAIYENYGLTNAAIAAYKQVEPQENEMSRAEDTYLLAQQRLTLLTGHPAGPDKK